MKNFGFALRPSLVNIIILGALENKGGLFEDEPLSSFYFVFHTAICPLKLY